MHPKAIESHLKKIYGTLQQAVVVDGMVDFGSLDGLSDLNLDKASKWINHDEIKLLVLSRVGDKLYESLDEYQGPWNLKDVVEENYLRATAQYVVDVLMSLPHETDVSVCLPRLQFPEEFEAQLGNFRIFSTKTVPTGLLQDGSPQFSFNIGSKAFGYAGSSLECTATSTGLDCIRVILNDWINREIVSLNRYRISRGGLIFNAMNSHVVEKMHVSVVAPAIERNCAVPLPIDLSVALASIEPGRLLQSLPKATQPTVFVASSERLKLLLEDNSDEAKSIRSAAEWCFNSRVGENDTLSFLQVCFGLEALFGDGNSESVTRTLATRAAYAVASRISQRKELAERFTKLYEVRSSIVHGKVGRLAPKQMEHFYWGLALLSTGIEVEMAKL